MAHIDGVLLSAEKVTGRYHRWHLAVATEEYWEEFKKHYTVERKNGQDLSDVKEEEFKMKAFLHLLSLLMGGCDPDTKYMGSAEGTPLETALGIFENMVTWRTVCLSDWDVQIARLLICKQAVVVCIQAGNHAKARDVFHRLWDKENLSAVEQKVKEEIAEILRDKTGAQKQKFIKDNSYARFHKAMVKILEKVQQKFKKAWLQDLEKKTLTTARPEAVTGVDSDEMNVVVDWREGIKREMEQICGNREDVQVDDARPGNGYEIIRVKRGNVLGWNPVKSCAPQVLAEMKTAQDKENAKRQKRCRDPESSDDEEESDLEGGRRVSLGKKLICTCETDTGGNSGMLLVQQDNNSMEDGADDTSADTTPHREVKCHTNRLHIHGLKVKPKIKDEKVPWSDSDSDISTPPSRRLQPLSSSTPMKIRTPGSLRRAWSDQEKANLKRGVQLCGTGKWSEILKSFHFNNRTNVNLKDKWRTMKKTGEV